jgi:hypothetical protein
MLAHVYAASVDEERHRGEGERHARHRALLATRAVRPSSRALRPSLPARLGAATTRLVRRDRHSLTDYPCRLPDGKIGRTAVVLNGSEWSLVCRVA